VDHGFSQVIVLGAGAVGSLIGARLTAPTVLVGRREHVTAMLEHGLKISGLEDDRVEVDASETCPTIEAGSLVLVAVKMGDIEQSGQILAPLLHGDTEVAVLSNGLDPDRRLSRILGRPVRRVIVQLGVTLERPGEVSTWGGALMLGPGDTEDRLAVCFEQAGFPVKRTHDLERVIWQKLAANCVANPLSALTGCCNQDLITPELRGLRQLIVEEVRQLAATEGVDLSVDFLDRLDAALLESKNQTSMLQDIRRGRPTEIEFLNGLVARRMVDKGLDAPVNRALAEMVRMLSEMNAVRGARWNE